MTESPLVSVHVPKTAGTAFQLVLHQFFGNRLWLDHGVPADPPEHAACVHGHAPASARLAQYPDSPMVTWVRDPVDRLLSHYHYWLRRPDPGHPACRRLHEDGLGPAELAELLPDVQRQMLDVELSRFDFVGVVERSDLSLALLERILGRSGLVMPRSNTTGPVDVGNDVRRRIAEVCAADVELYREAIGHLKANLAARDEELDLARWARALPGTAARGYGRAA